MPKITVLTITNRRLYFPEQRDALKAQTFKDFEWVIVDANYKENKKYIADIVSTHFPYLHLNDRDEKAYFAGAQAYNQGIIHSRGELVYFMSDYILPHPKCLERHWYIYNKYKSVFISGKSARLNCTPVYFDSVIGITPAQDYRVGIMSDSTQIEDKLYLMKNTMSPQWWSGRNDSAPLEALLECNGFEEKLDGNWGGHDGELANRMVTYGLFYLYDTQSLCLEFAHISGQALAKKKEYNKTKIRTDVEQLRLSVKIVRRKLKQKRYTSDNKYSLREERNKWIQSA